MQIARQYDLQRNSMLIRTRVNYTLAICFEKALNAYQRTILSLVLAQWSGWRENTGADLSVAGEERNVQLEVWREHEIFHSCSLVPFARATKTDVICDLPNYPT